jgi:hypothetical protein
MLMNRAFFLACATAVTLGVAAASSTSAYARPCSNADSVDEERSCLIRNAISHARAAAAEAAETAESARSKRSGNGSTAKTTKSTTPSNADAKTNTATSNCLRKEYDGNGVVTFRDTCTGEWASSAAQRGM